MLVIALSTLMLPALTHAAEDTSSTFWWRFPLSDCGYDDIGTPNRYCAYDWGHVLLC
jgi:hypothetical protein